MIENDVFNFLKKLADKNDVLICKLDSFKKYPTLNEAAIFLIKWRNSIIGKDGKVGGVCICINPLEKANELILNTRFESAYNTLKNNEPKAA